MSGPTFQSVPTALANILRRALPDTVTVATRVPDDHTIVSSTPLVVVAQDGPGEVRQRIHQRAFVRVLAWHEDDDQTDDLIQAVNAEIQAADTTGTQVVSVLPGTAPWVTTDPDTGGPMGEFTCTANTIAQQTRKD